MIDERKLRIYKYLINVGVLKLEDVPVEYQTALTT